MAVDKNSVDAYYEDMERLETIRDRVYYIVEHATHPSSSDIARLMKTERTTITGRLKELENDDLIYKADTKKDPWTGKTVNWYAPTYRREQLQKKTSQQTLGGVKI